MNNVIKFKQKPPKTDMEFAKGLSISALKLIWDDLCKYGVDGFTYSDGIDTFYINDEMVHEILNGRGEGDYCSI